MAQSNLSCRYVDAQVPLRTTDVRGSLRYRTQRADHHYTCNSGFRMLYGCPYRTTQLYDMKTTLEISDPLLRDARKVAARERTTLRALVEQGLRQVLAERSRRKRPFRLRKASVKGRGLQPEFADGGWDRTRDTIYDGRGS
jgi:hypothetical protein